MAKKTKSEKVIVWLACSVVLSLLPIAANAVLERFGSTPQPPIKLIVGGELFLISAAIAADATGRALLGGDNFRRIRLACGLGCIVLLLLNSFYFLVILIGSRKTHDEMGKAIQNKNWDDAQKAHLQQEGNERIALDSLWLFGFTTLTAFGAILVEED